MATKGAGVMRSPGMSERERLERLDVLCAEERRATASRLASTVAHALGTPLNVILGRAAMISLGELSPDEVLQSARIIEEQVRSVTRLLQTMLRFTRDRLPPSEPEELGAVFAEVVSLLAPLAEARGVQLSLLCGARLLGRVPRARLAQVLTELLSFALGLVPRGERLELSLARSDGPEPEEAHALSAPGPQACFTFQLGGVPSSLVLPGAEQRARSSDVFEPWLAAEPGDRRAALALALAFGIAREHGAWIESGGDRRRTTLSLHWPLEGR
jgi:two-component system NtrC family sensor kinase